MYKCFLNTKLEPWSRMIIASYLKIFKKTQQGELVQHLQLVHAEIEEAELYTMFKGLVFNLLYSIVSQGQSEQVDQLNKEPGHDPIDPVALHVDQLQAGLPAETVLVELGQPVVLQVELNQGRGVTHHYIR